MNLPEAGHPIWSIVRLAVVGIIFTTASHVLYDNGWDQKDWYTLLALMLGSGGISATQMFGAAKAK